jgi:endonuclease YncB( thermonuclease family)
MAKGLLEVRGRIALEQFWPDGEADADTTKVKVKVDDGAFRFQEFPGAPFQVTHAFENARVRGRVSKEIIDTKDRVTIRLQGVDAPELHYTPQAVKRASEQTRQQRALFLELNHKYRQHFAESATVALADFLEDGEQDPLPCRVLTAVDEPDDAIDTYGRLVGDIEVKVGGNVVNLNQWLTAQGWTVPAFYNSMSADEIRVLLELGQRAHEKELGFWPHLAKKVGTLDFDLRYRKMAPEGEADDAGPVLMPKLFRRLTTWAVSKRARMLSTSFKSFLAAKRDTCYALDEFLEQGVTAATPHNLSDFIGAGGTLLARPHDLVFHEEGAKLIGPDGTTPTW